jgi:membrane associated rhomboid family serine protease
MSNSGDSIQASNSSNSVGSRNNSEENLPYPFDHRNESTSSSLYDTEHAFQTPIDENMMPSPIPHPNVDESFDEDASVDFVGASHDEQISIPTAAASPISAMESPTSKPPVVPRVADRDTELFRHIRQNELDPDKIDDVSPALKRRLRDFNFAQKKRRELYGERQPWGIIGLYDHLSGIRTDIEWAEDAAWRREHGEPYLSWQDFENAKDSGLNQPFFTYIIMIVCTVCLIISIGMNDWKVEPLTVNPMIGPSAQTLIDVGAKKTSLIVNEGEWYRLFTPMFLHAGIIHFVLNMLALWFIGYAVEQNHGFLNVAILFIVPATGGTIISALFLPEYISVGASGGIFGLIGGCIADIIANWNLLFSKELNQGESFKHVKVLIWLMLDILLNVIIGLTPFVDNFTHLGGMVYGLLCGLSTLERLSKAFFGVKRGLCSVIVGTFLRFFGVILSVFCIIITVVILAESDGKRISNCRGCRYVSCVPFPFWADSDNKWWYCDDCDLVSADARQSLTTDFYNSMNLTCPDGEEVFIDLTENRINDQQYLSKQLPKFCRDYCESLFE